MSTGEAHERFLPHKLTVARVQQLREWWAEPHGLSGSAFCRWASERLRQAGCVVKPETIRDVIMGNSWAWVKFNSR